MYILVRNKPHIEDILEISRGRLRVKTQAIVCDLYRFLEGESGRRTELSGRIYERLFLGEYDGEPAGVATAERAIIVKYILNHKYGWTNGV